IGVSFFILQGGSKERTDTDFPAVFPSGRTVTFGPSTATCQGASAGRRGGALAVGALAKAVPLSRGGEDCHTEKGARDPWPVGHLTPLRPAQQAAAKALTAPGPGGHGV